MEHVALVPKGLSTFLSPKVAFLVGKMQGLSMVPVLVILASIISQEAVSRAPQGQPIALSCRTVFRSAVVDSSGPTAPAHVQERLISSATHAGLVLWGPLIILPQPHAVRPAPLPIRSSLTASVYVPKGILSSMVPARLPPH